MWCGGVFSGTKIALICEAYVVAYLRDEKEGIPFPGMWDLPGGGREGEEDPIECALREVEEEFGLRIPAERVQKLTRYQGPSPSGMDTYFCLANIEPDEIDQVQFGEEGQRWSMMAIEEFIRHTHAVPHLQERLAQLLSDY